MVLHPEDDVIRLVLGHVRKPRVVVRPSPEAGEDLAGDRPATIAAEQHVGERPVVAEIQPMAPVEQRRVPRRPHEVVQVSDHDDGIDVGEAQGGTVLALGEAVRRQEAGPGVHQRRYRLVDVVVPDNDEQARGLAVGPETPKLPVSVLQEIQDRVVPR